MIGLPWFCGVHELAWGALVRVAGVCVAVEAGRPCVDVGFGDPVSRVGFVMWEAGAEVGPLGKAV